jgi:hypothetical protein
VPDKRPYLTEVYKVEKKISVHASDGVIPEGTEWNIKCSLFKKQFIRETFNWVRYNLKPCPGPLFRLH